MGDWTKKSGKSVTAILGWTSVLFCLAGCIEQGKAHFDLTEASHKTDDCLSNAFPMDLSVMNVVYREDSRGIFLQTRAGSFENADLVYFEVFHSTRRDVELPIGQKIADERSVLVEIELGESCDVPQSLRIDGFAYFDELDTADEGRISGHLHDATLYRLRRDGWNAVGTISGFWDFEVLHTRTRR